jgi:Na+:H+ antiporter, NhaA family
MSALTRLSSALRSDPVSGSLLIGSALLALAWANSPLAGGYRALWSLRVGPAAPHLDLTLAQWAADGLLAIFFLVVGIELRHELAHGELRDRRHAALPVAAALGGVLVPALMFIAVSRALGGSAAGWGVPMATDIAFALAVLALAGRRLPGALRTFLLALATVDDICAVLVIAVAHTGGLDPTAGLAALGALLVFGLLQRTRVPGWVPLLLGVLIWALVHASGVHATIAGVAMGLLLRTRTLAGESDPPSRRAGRVWAPVSAGLVLPLFALATAGLDLRGAAGFWDSAITWGVLAGLLAGKAGGIVGASWLTARFTGARLSPRLGWADVAGVGVLGGVGFTVSLLIAELSYPEPAELATAKGAVLLATTVAALLAAAVLRLRSRRRDPAPG